MELLTRLWTKFLQRWPIVLACLAVAVVGAAFYNAGAGKSYTASTELFLRAPDVKTSVTAYQGDLFSRQRAQTYVNMFGSDELAQMVIDKLGLSVTPQQLVSNVSASVVKNTVLMVISVTDSNAQHAANIANGYGGVLGNYIAKVENVSGDPNVGPLVEVVTKASPASAEVSGYPTSMVVLVAVVLALFAAAGLIMFLERFDTKVRSRRQVEEITGCDIIGKLPKTPLLGSDKSVAQVFGDSAEFKQASLRLSLNVESVLQRLPRVKAEIPAVVAIVGGSRGEGGTVVAQALAQAFGHRGRTAGVVRVGDSNQEPVEPELVVAGSALSNLDKRTDPVTTVSCSTAALTSEIGGRDALLLESDIILVDTPPFHESVDAQVALGAVDAAVLVVRPIATSAHSLGQLVAGIRALDVPVLGVVVNMAKESLTTEGLYL